MTTKVQETVADFPAHTLRAAMVTGRMNRRAWLVTGLLVVFQIINFADKAVIGLVAGPAMHDLGLSAGEYGFIGSSFFFLFAIASVVVGFVAGRVSTRWILLAMGIAWGVLMFPIFLGAGAAALLITRIMLGAAEGPATPISLQHVHAWFMPKDRGLPSNMVAIGSTLGPIIAAPVLAWVIAHPDLGWRWAFGFLGIAGLLWALAWLFIGKDGPFGHLTGRKAASRAATNESASQGEAGAAGEAGAPGEAARTTAPPNAEGSPELEVTGNSIASRSDLLKMVPFRRLLGTRMFIVAVLAGAGCFWAMGFLTTWAPKYLGAVVKLSPEMVGVMFTFPWIVGALALLVMGYASRFLMRAGVTVRWAIGAMFAGALLISGICFLILPHVTGYAAVVVLTIGAGLAMIYPMAPTAVAFSVCSRQRAAVMATLGGLASLGGVVAPAMVGFLMDKAGYVPGAESPAAAAEMAGRLADGMNQAFWMIGIYLVVVGIAGVLLLNPDKTAKRLQDRFAFEG